ncbi:14-3-3 protein gamma-like [Styela clava]|uniref:14-3-3 protein gamma-like n=1 Tax=Styela clava TaxID=7725 RepID=UPI0019398763|nr:14-3-3 protein gamma-like [Styela clava]
MADSKSSKEDLVIMARLSEQAERYDDMMKQMKELAKLGDPLSSEERNLFSVAYKNVVGARRSAWRVLTSIRQREEERGSDEMKITQAAEYIKQIASEIEGICAEVVELVDQYLLKSIKDKEDHESVTFYLKMKGDYYRYVAEVLDTDEQKTNSDSALGAYEEAYKICKEQMHAAHPIRLGLALNFSVFFYEIQADPERAQAIAKEAFDEAMKVIENSETDDKKVKDSTLIMQLLRDNLSLWSASEQEDGDGDMEG